MGGDELSLPAPSSSPPAEEVQHEYGIDIRVGNDMPALNDYQAIVLAVAHKEFNQLQLQASAEQVVYDVKAVLPKAQVDGRL